MITELRIADLGVISDAIISLHPGLTVVTGETGAGTPLLSRQADMMHPDRRRKQQERRQDDDHQRARPAARRPG